MKTRKIALLGILTAGAIIISVIESFIPSIGIPGIKLGLANIVILLTIYEFEDISDDIIYNSITNTFNPSSNISTIEVENIDEDEDENKNENENSKNENENENMLKINNSDNTKITTIFILLLLIVSFILLFNTFILIIFNIILMVNIIN